MIISEKPGVSQSVCNIFLDTAWPVSAELRSSLDPSSRDGSVGDLSPGAAGPFWEVRLRGRRRVAHRK